MLLGGCPDLRIDWNDFVVIQRLGSQNPVFRLDQLFVVVVVVVVVCYVCFFGSGQSLLPNWKTCCTSCNSTVSCICGNDFEN